MYDSLRRVLCEHDVHYLLRATRLSDDAGIYEARLVLAALCEQADELVMARSRSGWIGRIIWPEADTGALCADLATQASVLRGRVRLLAHLGGTTGTTGSVPA